MVLASGSEEYFLKTEESERQDGFYCSANNSSNSHIYRLSQRYIEGMWWGVSSWTEIVRNGWVEGDVVWSMPDRFADTSSMYLGSIPATRHVLKVQWCNNGGKGPYCNCRVCNFFRPRWKLFWYPLNSPSWSREPSVGWSRRCSYLSLGVESFLPILYKSQRCWKTIWLQSIERLSMEILFVASSRDSLSYLLLFSADILVIQMLGIFGTGKNNRHYIISEKCSFWY